VIVLKESLEHDFFDPLVVNGERFLVSGHLRARVLREMGVEAVDCVIVNYDEETHLARMIAANSQIGTFDDSLLPRSCPSASSRPRGLTDAQVAELIANGRTEPVPPRVSPVPRHYSVVTDSDGVRSKNSCGLSVVEPQQPARRSRCRFSRRLAHRFGGVGNKITFPSLDGFSRVEMLRVVRKHVPEELSPNKISFDRHSSFTERFHRSRCAFKFGLRGGRVTTWMPAASRIPSKAAQNLASRSCSRYRHPQRNPMSASVTLRAICPIQRESGEVVIPAIHTFLDATRMKVST